MPHRHELFSKLDISTAEQHPSPPTRATAITMVSATSGVLAPYGVVIDTDREAVGC